MAAVAEAARLVDAQAGSLANRIRRLAGLVGASPDWHSDVLAELGLLHLLAQAGRRLGSLPGAMLGGLLIGLIETLWSAYFSVEYKDVAAFSILIVGPVTVSATALSLRSTVFVGTTAIIVVSVLLGVHVPLRTAEGIAYSTSRLHVLEAGVMGTPDQARRTAVRWDWLSDGDNT